jgi:hypothetical protein
MDSNQINFFLHFFLKRSVFQQIKCFAAIGPERADLIHFVSNSTSSSRLNSLPMERIIVHP